MENIIRGAKFEIFLAMKSPPRLTVFMVANH